ncbi:hypothetical protein NIES3585_21470 [Nodularia sp. NIES-3585]|nr:hypothetical protein NIES3585_21470 [Nodularia sp. NIES-3585]
MLIAPQRYREQTNLRIKAFFNLAKVLSRIELLHLCRVCYRVAQRTILDSRCVMDFSPNAPYPNQGF